MQFVDLVIRNARVVSESGLIEGGVAVDRGVIVQIGSELPEARTVVDARGQYLLPGFIDPHVHLGIGDGSSIEKMRRDFLTESADAASGGVTTMITTTLLGASSRGEVAEQALDAGNSESLVDYRLTSVITRREHLQEISDLVRLGIRSYKFYLGYKGAQAETLGMSAEGIGWDFFYEACEALGEAGVSAFPTVHAEDPYVRDFLHDRLKGGGPARQLRRWLETSPNILEPMQIYPAALIAREVGIPLYIVHVSAWQSVDLLRKLQWDGWPVYGETLSAFLYWTALKADDSERGVYGKVQPPLRLGRDRSALWEGIADGTLRSIATDCQMYPHTMRENIDFWDASVGLGPGMGTMAAAVHTAGVLNGLIDIEQMSRVLSENTARRFDLYPQKGVIRVGADADLVVFDPTQKRTVSPAKMHSGSKFSLFAGEELQGWPTSTYVRGQLVFRDGFLFRRAQSGRHIPPTQTGALS